MKSSGLDWTQYHLSSLKEMKRLERTIRYKERNRPLVRRIDKCVEYLEMRALRGRPVPP